MKMMINEDQFKLIFEHQPELNSKPAVEFDKKYGTQLAGHYNFSTYTDDEIWKYWIECRDSENCENFIKTFDILSKAFPYYDTNKLDLNDKKDVMLGMVSGFNPFDIVWFTIKGVKAFMNKEQHDIETKLNGMYFGWVLSPESLQQVKEKFSLI